MKTKIFYIIAALFFAIGFVACNDGDGDADYGFGYIYMPQATISGGLNNNYYVPSGSGEYTYNFKVDLTTNKVKVILGVLRSGDIGNSAYSVDIVSRTDTTNQIIVSGAISNALILPASLYSLPNSVSVSGSESGTSFYMEIPIDALKMDQYTDKNLVMTVGLANPTAFQLSPKNTSTVVIINVNSLRTKIEEAQAEV
ncbi:hypothetical protein [Dysgonomonas sp.]